MEFFRQLHTQSHACTITLPVTLGSMNLAHYNKAFETFRRVSIEGHAVHVRGIVVAVAFYMSGLQVLQVQKLPKQYKKLTTQ